MLTRRPACERSTTGLELRVCQHVGVCTTARATPAASRSTARLAGWQGTYRGRWRRSRARPTTTTPVAGCRSGIKRAIKTDPLLDLLPAQAAQLVAQHRQ